jgi:hypothetical protein
VLRIYVQQHLGEVGNWIIILTHLVHVKYKCSTFIKLVGGCFINLSQKGGHLVVMRVTHNFFTLLHIHSGLVKARKNNYISKLLLSN